MGAFKRIKDLSKYVTNLGIQHHRISLNGTRVVRGLSKINDLQSRILRALGVPTPDINSIDRQLELGL